MQDLNEEQTKQLCHSQESAVYRLIGVMSTLMLTA